MMELGASGSVSDSVHQFVSSNLTRYLVCGAGPCPEDVP